MQQSSGCVIKRNVIEECIDIYSPVLCGLRWWSDVYHTVNEENICASLRAVPTPGLVKRRVICDSCAESIFFRLIYSKNSYLMV